MKYSGHLPTAFCIAAAAILYMGSGCMTKTAYISDDGLVNGEEAQNVAGFSEKDIQICVSKALKQLPANRLVKYPGSIRAVITLKTTIDTMSRGRDAAFLKEALEMEFAQQLTDSGQILVLDKNAQSSIEPQYVFQIRARERILVQDDSNAQKEYNLNLQLIDVKSGLIFWQRRIPLRKLVDKNNVML